MKSKISRFAISFVMLAGASWLVLMRVDMQSGSSQIVSSVGPVSEKVNGMTTKPKQNVLEVLPTSSIKSVAKNETIKERKDNLNELRQLLENANAGVVPFETVSDAFTLYVDDPSISREDKIATLLRLFKNNNGPYDLYLVDVLYGLHPIEITDDLIRGFSKKKDPEVQRHLISILADIANTSEDPPIGSEHYRFIAEKSESIQSFFRTLIEDGDDPEVVGKAITSVQRVFPSDMAVQILERIPTPPVIPPDTDRTNALTPSDLAHVWFQVALESPESQEKYLGRAIDQFETLPGVATDEEFGPLILHLMGDDFLLGNNAELNLKARQFIGKFPRPTDGGVDYYEWIKAQAAVQSTSQEEKNAHILERLKNGPIEDQVCIVGISQLEDTRILSRLSPEELERLVDSIQSKLTGVSPVIRNRAANALSDLSDLNSWKSSQERGRIRCLA